ncbi:MAG: helix-turn-helix domain-containing protein [Bacteroidales bacterium]|nr:helix-turn-helix domain-containing protein [Bacteroidales bacterium]
MLNDVITFNDVPQLMAEMLARMAALEENQKAFAASVSAMQQGTAQHVPMTVEELSAYINTPLKTVYEKLGKGDIPAYKPGKHWVVYRDEIDQWLLTTRRTPVPPSDDEMLEEIRDSHRTRRRKDKKAEDKADEASPSSPAVSGGNAEDADGVSEKGTSPSDIAVSAAVTGTPQPLASFNGLKVPPTLDEVNGYIASRELNVDGRAFFDYYEGQHWKTSGDTPVKNWMSLLNACASRNSFCK